MEQAILGKWSQIEGQSNRVLYFVSSKMGPLSSLRALALFRAAPAGKQETRSTSTSKSHFWLVVSFKGFSTEVT